MSHASRRLKSVLSRLGFGVGLGVYVVSAVVGAAIFGATPAKADNIIKPGCTCSGFVSGNQCFNSSTFQPQEVVCQSSQEEIQANIENQIKLDQLRRDREIQEQIDKQINNQIAENQRKAEEAAKIRKSRENTPTDTAGMFAWMMGFGADPYGYVAGSRNSGSGVSSSNGTVTGQSISSDTTYAGGGGAFPVNLNHTFNLGSGETFRVGALLNYESQDTDYGTNSVLRNFGIGSAASENRNIYTAGGFLRYDFGNTYVGGFGLGNGGNGSYKDKIFDSKGDFDSDGYLAAGGIGHVFTLADRARYNASGSEAVGGYTVGLDLSGNAGAYNDTINSFKEKNGLRWGDEVYRYGFVGGDAKLSLTLYDATGWTWTPFVAGTFLQEFDREHSLKVPAQSLSVDGGPDLGVIEVPIDANVIHFHDDTTYWGGRWGLDITTLSGWRFGANGWAGATGDQTDVGGRGYFVVPFGGWHSASTTPPPAPIK